MERLFINTRDELHIIDLDDILYLQASGNYTDFHFTDGQVKSEIQPLSHFQASIASLYTSCPNPFYRLGRSHLINTARLTSINLQKEQLTLSGSPPLKLSFSKRLLKPLKEYMMEKHGKTLQT